MTPPFWQALLRGSLDALQAYSVPAEAPAVKLDANESPWPLPAEARARLLEVLGEIRLRHYPDPQALALKDALATRFGGEPSEYLVGSGSDEVIALLATALSEPREGAAQPVVLYPEPTFVMYGITGLGHGWRARSVPLTARWQLDEEAMRRALQEVAPNVVYYASPNNPTGNLFDEDVLERLISAFPNTLHVIDEAYAPFSDQRLGAWCERWPQVGVLGTLSKVGFAAIRCGWLRADARLVAELNKVRQPFNLNAYTQAAAHLALTELRPVVDAQIAAVIKERERLCQALGDLADLQVHPSQANFLLCAVSAEVGAVQLAARLREAGIGIRAFGDQGMLANQVRITVGLPEENDALLHALTTMLKK